MRTESTEPKICPFETRFPDGLSYVKTWDRKSQAFNMVVNIEIAELSRFDC